MNLLARFSLTLTGLLFSQGLFAQIPQTEVPDEASAADAPASTTRNDSAFDYFVGKGNPYSRVSVANGLSSHKPMYVLPLTYSPDYDGNDSELAFQISGKMRVWNALYFGYTQKSFWSIYDSDNSRPFRETNYNPEIFYRWIPDPDPSGFWGADAGIEHESNGESLPRSRSWNRIYLSPFLARGASVYVLKLWYRLPEDEKETPDDPKGDDNPDIDDYYGYGELYWQYQLGSGQQLRAMVRGNPKESHGAIDVEYTIPSRSHNFFYQIYLWHGYGESLIDYNESVTRIGFGIALTR